MTRKSENVKNMAENVKGHYAMFLYNEQRVGKLWSHIL